jgi:argininosuccinate lyase
MVGALTELSRGRRRHLHADRGRRGRARGARARPAPRSSARLGGKLRAGRSRNDQVATDLRLLPAGTPCAASVGELAALEVRAGGPGRAGTATSGAGHDPPAARPAGCSSPHQLLAHAHSFARDVDRLQDWDRRSRRQPLGSGALAGSSLPLDPDAVAAELGFDRAADNSDRRGQRPRLRRGVLLRRGADRRAPLPAGGGGRALDVDRVRLGALDDAWATGSSIMPQKKNPDIAELARGKSGRFVGNLTGLLTMLKGLPLAYDRDLQEDKEPVFDSLEQLLLLLPGGHRDGRHADAAPGGAGGRAPQGFALATDVAEWLVRRGVPFRSAHEVSGAMVASCEQAGLELDELDDDQLAGIDERLTPEVRAVLSVRGALEARSTRGGTAPDRVAEQLSGLRDAVAAHGRWAAGSPVAAAL